MNWALSSATGDLTLYKRFPVPPTAVVDAVTVTPGSIAFTGKAITGLETTSISQASSVFAGQTVSLPTDTGGADDAATTAWVAAVVTAGGTVSTPRKTLINALIAGLKSDGVWTKLDRLHLYAMENQKSATIDLKALVPINENSAPVFSTDEGYTGTGLVPASIDLNWNPTTAGGSWTLNNAHVFVWNLTHPDGGPPCLQELYGDNVNIFPTYLDGITYFRLNMTGGGAFSVGASGIGFYLANRTDASTLKGYIDGSSIGTSSDSATAVPVNIYCPIWTTTDQIACCGGGGTLTDTDVSNLYSRLRTYMTAVGIP